MTCRTKIADIYGMLNDAVRSSGYAELRVRIIIDNKGRGRIRFSLDAKFRGGSGKNHDTALSVHSVSGPRFENGASQIRSVSTVYSTAVSGTST